MPATTTHVTRLDHYLPHSERGNHTSIEIAAPPATVWAALNEVTLSECRTSKLLLAIRGLPGRIARRGAFGSRPRGAERAERPLLASMTDDRFAVLEELPGEEIVLGVIGQFWKVSGGIDAPIADAAEFRSFDRPGYVRTAVNFLVRPGDGGGSVLSTETRCVTTDAAARRRFAVYWALIGWGSKLIRRDMLTAVRRRAEAHDAGTR